MNETTEVKQVEVEIHISVTQSTVNERYFGDRDELGGSLTVLAGDALNNIDAGVTTYANEFKSYKFLAEQKRFAIIVRVRVTRSFINQSFYDSDEALEPYLGVMVANALGNVDSGVQIIRMSAKVIENQVVKMTT